MNAKKHLPNYSYQDYEQWEGSWELIAGIPYAMSPAPNIQHQKISAKMIRYFDEALEHCKACYISMPVDWKIDKNTVVQPDLLLICHETTGQYLEKAPELVVEILSPSTAHKDRHLKYELYEEQGVKYYLIVNPVDETIEIYCLDQSYQLVSNINKVDAKFEFSVKDCQFQMDFSGIW